MSFLGLRMLKNPKKPIYKNCNIFEKYPKGGPFDFFFLQFSLITQNFTMEYQRRLLECHLGGLQMFKSPK